MPTIYYGIVVIGSLIIALVAYGIAMLGWRSFRHRLPAGQRSPGGRLDMVFLCSYPASVIKYKRRGGGVEEASACGGEEEIINDNEECVVCLSGFEDGDDVRQMPRCKHLFHAGCIDMWLYSHSYCPICRSPVDRPALYSEPSSMEDNHSQEVMLQFNISS